MCMPKRKELLKALKNECIYWALCQKNANCKGDNGTRASSVEVWINDEHNQDPFVADSFPAACNYTRGIKGVHSLVGNSVELQKEVLKSVLIGKYFLKKQLPILPARSWINWGWKLIDILKTHILYPESKVLLSSANVFNTTFVPLSILCLHPKFYKKNITFCR